MKRHCLIELNESSKLYLKYLFIKHNWSFVQERMNQKLRYAELHLTEIIKNNSLGDDFERAHSESFLFHLLGAKDAFLKEYCLYFQLDCEHISLKNVQDSYKRKCDVASIELEAIYCLQRDKNSWFNIAKVFRDYGTHVGSTTRQYKLKIGHEPSSFAYLTHPISKLVIEKDFRVMYKEWLEKMTELLMRLRKQAVIATLKDN